MNVSGVKALVFDVFGTVVDWRSSIIKHGENFGRIHGVEADWGAFADSWRSKYQPFMNRVRTGDLPWTNLDALHRMALDDVLGEMGITGISNEATAELNLAWHDLEPWGDSVPGLYRLKHRFIIAPLSNGNVALMTNMAKNGGLPWDCILGAELARHYKPDPESYLTAVELLGLEPRQVMMVAAHQSDLLAAGKAGLMMAFVPRPLEHGPGCIPDPTADLSFDVVATDFIDLARQLNG